MENFSILTYFLPEKVSISADASAGFMRKYFYILLSLAILGGGYWYFFMRNTVSTTTKTQIFRVTR